ncbi:MAG: pyridoxal phosphate enzyme (YggS family) [Candidatus Omnitrophota bacterium]|jgi:pyridoxal phosphate enzyme (YggS family)
MNENTIDNPSDNLSIRPNLEALRKNVARITTECNRPEGSVRIVAVSKTFTEDKLRVAMNADQIRFGENKMNEGEGKINALKNRGIKWHFIGRIQSNKIRRVFLFFDIIESIDRKEVLQKAEQFLKSKKLTKEAYLQVNISGDAKQGGIPVEELVDWVKKNNLNHFQHCQIKGLMAIGPNTADTKVTEACFKRLHEVFIEAQTYFPQIKTLSLGMSNDYELAIAHGSTSIRIGTSIFGMRTQLKVKSKFGLEYRE